MPQEIIYAYFWLHVVYTHRECIVGIMWSDWDFDWLIDRHIVHIMLCTGIQYMCVCVQCCVHAMLWGCVCVCSCVCMYSWVGDTQLLQWTWSRVALKFISWTINTYCWHENMIHSYAHNLPAGGHTSGSVCRGGAFSLVTCVNTIRCEFGISFWNLCECYRMANQNPIIECCSCFYTHPIMCDVQKSPKSCMTKIFPSCMWTYRHMCLITSNYGNTEVNMYLIMSYVLTFLW